ncbi:UNVERIFIED_ORG: hypothetical protein ABIC97_004136 [Peribacillus simplex]
MYSNLVSLQLPKTESLKEVLADFDMPYKWQFVVLFVIAGSLRQLKIIPRNKKLRVFYDKKREEGKPYKVAVIACVNKLLHWIFALLKNKMTFQDIVLNLYLTK